MPPVISRQHAISRRLRALRGDPALRAREGVLVAEGIHLAREALDAGARIEAAVIAPRLREHPEGASLIDRLGKAGVAVHEASDATLDALQDARSPQPIVLLVAHDAASLDRIFDGGKTSLVVVACGVQDPGNLGAILRTAEAAGATGFVASTGSAGLTHPRAVRATMGSIFRLPSTEASLEEVTLRKVALVGAAARGGTPYDAYDWTSSLALLLGSEGGGLPDEIMDRLDARVSIPLAPGVESLSVGAAAAVLLFEAARVRRKGTAT
jgi:TrmH family RNA methyltransferase